MTFKIEPIAAKSVFDPPAYSQAVKVTGVQSIIFISGQVDYDAKGAVGHPGDIAGQARATYGALKAQVEAAGGTVNVIEKKVLPADEAKRAKSAAKKAARGGGQGKKAAAEE